jgi:Barstar (barnase inhibitor)
MNWVDFRDEMPWLRGPPYWLAHANGPRLRSKLSQLGFEVFETSPGAAATEEEFLRGLAEAMDLEDYASKNWNAFVDAFGDLVRSTPKPIAVIWMDPAPAFVPDLLHGLRLYSMLSSILDNWNRVGPDCHQVELFLEGENRVRPMD